ncbi:MAG: SapC family protein [Nevskia sp.]|nr:SapC family protein [Nevskia sp.]
MSQITLQAPPGYGALTPFDRQRHAGLGLREDRTLGWCAVLNSVFLNAVELARAALDYPIAFVREESSGEFLPVAVLGLRAKENLFVDREGRWSPHAYIPAYVRRHPFCIAEIPAAEGAEPQRLVCVQEDQLAPSASPLLDSRGEATPTWVPLLQLIEAVEGARQQTRAFTRRLEAFGLFTPFDALALPRDGQQLRLQGMHRVDEDRLNALGAREQKLLMRKGELRAVYAHLLSLENFAKLLNLTAEKDGRRDTAH